MVLTRAAHLEATREAVAQLAAAFDSREANERLRTEDPAAYAAKMREQLPTSTCNLCGETFRGHGHNAHPVRDEGVACDECNMAIVVPERFRKWAP